MMEKITGLIDAPFAPFYENDDVNYEPLGMYTEFSVKNGLKGVSANGSSGESYMLTDEERMKLTERWLGISPTGFKVMVHMGSACTRPSRRLAAHAQSVGAYAIGAMTPPFPRIDRVEGLVAYCREIACGAPRLPSYFYRIPAFSRIYLSMTKFLETVNGRTSNFTGVKYTYENLYGYNQCRLYKDGEFDMLHGQDKTLLPCLATGGVRGGIGGTTNYNGRTLVGILDAWKSGDLERAKDLQNFVQQVINVVYHHRGNIMTGKRIMKLLGLDLGKDRIPFRNMTGEEESTMGAGLEKIHFFGRCNKF